MSFSGYIVHHVHHLTLACQHANVLISTKQYSWDRWESHWFCPYLVINKSILTKYIFELLIVLKFCAIVKTFYSKTKMSTSRRLYTINVWGTWTSVHTFMAIHPIVVFKNFLKVYQLTLLATPPMLFKTVWSTFTFPIHYTYSII